MTKVPFTVFEHVICAALERQHAKHQVFKENHTYLRINFNSSSNFETFEKNFEYFEFKLILYAVLEGIFLSDMVLLS